MSYALAIAIGIHMVEALNPGIIAGIAGDLLSGLKTIEMGIWNMLCDVADACADFMRYILRTRSG